MNRMKLEKQGHVEQAAVLLELTAVELVDGFRSRRISPVEVTQVVLRAAESAQSTVNAFVTLDHEGALVAARAAERRWLHGAELGPLDGVPISIKDNIYVKGMPTRYGSAAVIPWRADDADSPAAARLREAGAVIFGKTTTPDFAHKMVTDSPLTGVTRNPWSLAHTPGGSSGGADAAVAAALGPAAIGTDGAGSIRIPASWTGTYGFKPSLGRVPHHPRGAFGSYSHVGPITGTVADAARIMTVLSRPDARDWYSLPYEPCDYESALAQEVRGLRAAFSPRLGRSSLAVDPEISEAISRAATVFADLGVTVEVSDPPGVEECSEVSDIHFSACAARLVAQLGSQASVLDPSLLAL